MTRKLFTLAILGLLLSGCGRSLPDMAVVSGKVQFAGGPPPAAGVVHFQPLESGGQATRPGMGQFGLDGRFQVESFSGSKGLLPGRYRVRIECLSRQPSPIPGDYEKASYVPADYQPPELVVEKGQSRIDDLLYDVPAKKQ